MPHSSLLEKLEKLAAESGTVRLSQLWRVFPAERRQRAILSLIGEGDFGLSKRAALEVYIAEERNFRLETVKRWEDTKIAESAARLRWVDSAIINDALVRFHLTERCDLLSAYLDSLHIEHSGGVVTDEDSLEGNFDADLVCTAANDLLDRFSSVDVLTYLLALRSMYPTGFSGLDKWFRERKWSQFETPHVAESNTAIDEPEIIEADLDTPSEPKDFSTLDTRLIVTIVDSATSVTGALSQDQIDDLLVELVQLNSSRHRTYFHIGYRDALFSLPPNTNIPGANESRRRWYWAGFISGIGRQSNDQAIVDLFDAHEIVRQLGRLGDGPSFKAAGLVFRALSNANRIGEASAFVSEPALHTSSELRHSVLQVATLLVRNQRAAEARQMLEMLSAVNLEREGYEHRESDLADGFVINVKRRLALCLRQLLETERALTLLMELLETADDTRRAIVLADIGLIKSRHRYLGEMQLPANHDELDMFIDGLARGEKEFNEALEVGDFQPAHASFARGVLRFARGDYANAEVDLAKSLSHFTTQPEVYTLDGTLGIAELYDGLAICLSLRESGALPRACELIRSGLSRGARLPHWVIRSTIEALELVRGDLTQDIIASFVELGGSNVLDELITFENAGKSTVIRTELLQRARDVSRSGTRRSEDYRRVLPWLLDHRDIDSAAEALTYLESQAIADIGRDEFLSLLREETRYSPAWNTLRAGEARIVVHESNGQYDQAAWQAGTLIHQLLSSDDENSLDEALLLSKRLELYGSYGETILNDVRTALDTRLIRRDREESEVVSEGNENLHVNILVVGGNERQAKMEADIKETVRRKMPGVSLEFIQTGWNGNWAAYAEQFSRRVQLADGVVILTLIRTMLGGTIRSKCHVPWRACRGNGQGEIVTTIERVVPMARRFMTERPF